MKQLQGVFCPLTTPFHADGSLDLEGLARNMTVYGTSPVSGYLVLGSNGENKSIRLREKLQVAETVLKGKGRHQTAMVASIFESTLETIEFAQEVQRLGADYITLLPPSYFKKDMTDAALIRYFTDVAGALSTPCLLYNAPQYAGTVSLSAAVLRECAAHPNIVGLKDSSGDVKKSFFPLEDIPGFAFLSGSINTFLEALTLGATGGVISLANSAPHAVARLYDRMTRGEYAPAFALSKALIRANRIISGSYGVAGVKYAMELCGFAGGSPRLPLLPLEPQAKDAVRAAVAAVTALEEGEAQ